MATTILAIYLGLILQYILRDFILQLKFLLLSFNWSYLPICYFAVFISTYSVLTKATILTSIKPSRILLFIILILLALIAYLMGYVNEFYLVQYHGLSFVLIVFGLINIIFDLKGVTEALAILGVLLCTIPVPSSALSIFTAIFTPATGVSSRQILFLNPGLALAGSVLSTAPLIITTMYNDRFTRKSTARIISSLLAVITIGFTGDYFRILLSSQNTGLIVLNKLFSSTSIYVAISVFLVLLLNRRSIFLNYNSKGEVLYEKPKELKLLTLTAVSLVLLLALTSLIQVLLFISPSSGSLEIRVGNYSEFMSKPAYMIMSKLGLAVSNEHSYVYSDGMENIVLSEYNLSTNTSNYTGIMDLTRVPCKLYDLETFFKHEGYIVKQKWINENNGDTTTYYIVDNSSIELLVIVKLLRITLVENNSREDYYVRLALLTEPRDGVFDLTNVFNSMLSNSRDWNQFSQVFNMLGTLVSLLYVFIISLLIYLSLDPLRRVLAHA